MGGLVILRLLQTFATATFCIVSASAVLPSITLPTLNSTPNVGVIMLPTKHREVMVSVFYPVEVASSELLFNQQLLAYPKEYVFPYMPPATAVSYDSTFAPCGLPNGSFERLSTNCQLHAPMSKQRAENPIVMLSHGGGASRLVYTTISEELARLGYIVAAIDHPYDALIVEFPDGHIVKGGFEEIDRDLIKLLVKTRAQDVSFVIDELGRPSSKHPFEIDITDVSAFGHSLGGASVAEAALNDTRIKGGINVDGRLFGSLERPNTTLSKPFIQYQSEESAHGPPWNWDEEWQHLSGWKIQLLLKGAQHAAFTDMPLVIEALGLRKKWGRRGEEIIGKLDGLRGLEIMVAYVSAFVQLVLMGKNGSLLDGNGDGRFPEVKVVRTE